jgi:hypothetical protein
MEPGPGDEIRRRSEQLADAARQLVQDARARVEAARQSLDHARNVLQASWLRRAVRQRRKGSGS